ncbi:MAG: hypothetical protein FJ255_05320 [Phycisphaerae bacterium]|nr:hypothetical protein [Phycisphaerae bacterium]
MLVELLRPVGPELARRWLAALLLVPEGDRAGVVRTIEEHLAGLYGGAARGEEITLRHPPEQKQGYVEQVEVTYARPPAKPRGSRRRSAGD